MQRVERPERHISETDQKIACSDGMLIFQWMDLEKSLRDILFERCCRPPLRAGIDVVVSTATAEKATQLDHGEAADRHRQHTAKEVVEFIRPCFMQVAFGQSARINVNWAVQRDSRSSRTNTSLGTFNLGIEARSLVCEGI